jgi:hypothetical protein
LSRLLIGSRRSMASAFGTPRYASRSSTAAHHAVAITGCVRVTHTQLAPGFPPPGTPALTRADGVFGRSSVAPPTPAGGSAVPRAGRTPHATQTRYRTRRGTPHERLDRQSGNRSSSLTHRSLPATYWSPASLRA